MFPFLIAGISPAMIDGTAMDSIKNISMHLLYAAALRGFLGLMWSCKGIKNRIITLPQDGDTLGFVGSLKLGVAASYVLAYWTCTIYCFILIAGMMYVPIRAVMSGVYTAWLLTYIFGTVFTAWILTYKMDLNNMMNEHPCPGDV